MKKLSEAFTDLKRRAAPVLVVAQMMNGVDAMGGDKVPADKPDTVAVASSEISRLKGREFAATKVAEPRVKVDIFQTDTWKDFESKAEPHVVKLLENEIKDAKTAGYKDSQLIELVDYGMSKTIPANVALGIKWLSTSIHGRTVVFEDDIRKFYEATSERGGYDSFQDQNAGRNAHYNFAVDYALNSETGLLRTRIIDAILNKKDALDDASERLRLNRDFDTRIASGFQDRIAQFFFHVQ